MRYQNFTPKREREKKKKDKKRRRQSVIKNNCNNKHFFRDLYAKVRASGVLSVTPKKLWWRQNEAREKSAQSGNEFMKQVLVMVFKKVTL